MIYKKQTRQSGLKGKRGLIACRTCGTTGLFTGAACVTCGGKGYVGTQARMRNSKSGMIEQYRLLITRPDFDLHSHEWELCEAKNKALRQGHPGRPRKNEAKMSELDPGLRREDEGKLDPGLRRGDGQARTHVPTTAVQAGTHVPTITGQARTHVPTKNKGEGRVTAIVVVFRGTAADVREQVIELLHREEK